MIKIPCKPFSKRLWCDGQGHEFYGGTPCLLCQDILGKTKAKLSLRAWAKLMWWFIKWQITSKTRR